MTTSLENSTATSDPLPQPRRWLLAIKLAIVLLVLLGVQHSLVTAWRKLSEQELQFDWPWLIASGGIYLVGLLPAAWFWYWLLRCFDLPVAPFSTFRAHYIGHVGKYVPGKAMVFVIRIALLPRAGRLVGPASLAVFYETMTMMGVGACLAAIVLLGWQRATGLAAVVAICCGAGGVLVTLPPVLRLAGRLLERLRPGFRLAAELVRIDMRHVVVGWCANFALWLMLTLSFWAALRGVLPSAQVPLSEFPFYLASVALAMVAGFASLIPGGAFVREAVLLELLAPRYGAAVALVAALVVRVVWLVSEVLLSAILYVAGPREPAEAH